MFAPNLGDGKLDSKARHNLKQDDNLITSKLLLVELFPSLVKISNHGRIRIKVTLTIKFLLNVFNLTMYMHTKMLLLCDIKSVV